MDFSNAQFSEAGRACLVDALEIVKASGLKWWLEAGTCLGAVRDGGFIGHDTDIDIGLFGASDKTSREMIEKLEAIGFSAFPSRKYGTRYEWCVFRGDVKIDFFNFYDDGDIWWHRAGDHSNICYEFSKDLFTNLKMIDFMGIWAFIPNPPERYLAERYGDWHVKAKRWYWDSSPVCIRRIKREVYK